MFKNKEDCIASGIFTYAACGCPVGKKLVFCNCLTYYTEINKIRLIKSKARLLNGGEHKSDKVACFLSAWHASCIS